MCINIAIALSPVAKYQSIATCFIKNLRLKIRNELSYHLLKTLTKAL